MPILPSSAESLSVYLIPAAIYTDEHILGGRLLMIISSHLTLVDSNVNEKSSNISIFNAPMSHA